MIKRLTVAVAALFALGMQAFAAGTIPLSLTQQLDEFGKPLAGCRLFLIQAGTTSTPQNAFQDSALTITWPNPVICDASGRLPFLWFADGSIKIRLTKSNGVNVLTQDGIAVIGASSGGGGGSPVDPTTVLATGDVKVKYGTGVISGFVRMNGRTIGSATSGATERANADCQALFEYLWAAAPGLAVSGGRGATANADWVANKTIGLPDFRSRALAGLGDMGNSDNGLFAGTTFSFGNSTTLGSFVGAARTTLLQASLPNVTWPSTFGILNTLGISDPGHSHLYTNPVVGTAGQMASGAATIAVNSPTAFGASTAAAATGIAISGSVSITGSATSGGSGTAFDTISPYALVTMYIKL